MVQILLLPPPAGYVNQASRGHLELKGEIVIALPNVDPAELSPKPEKPPFWDTVVTGRFEERTKTTPNPSIIPVFPIFRRLW